MKRVIADVTIIPAISDIEVKKQYILRQMFELNARHNELIQDCLNGLSLFISVYKNMTERVLIDFNRGEYQLSELIMVYWSRLVRMNTLSN
jgi:hypothetical protein